MLFWRSRLVPSFHVFFHRYKNIRSFGHPGDDKPINGFRGDLVEPGGVGQLIGGGVDGGPAYMTLSKMMTLLSSVPGDSELRDLMSGAMYSRWWAPHTGVVR